jgi:hypothetical protein
MSPDIFLNLLVDERDLLRMTDVSLIVFDEAHNCHGRHPYAKIMSKYSAVAEGDRYGLQYVFMTSKLTLLILDSSIYNNSF